MFKPTREHIRSCEAKFVGRNLRTLTASGLLAVAIHMFEASTIVPAPDVLPPSTVTVSLGLALDADENSPALLDLITL